MVAALRRSILAFLKELGRCLAGSPQSRWRQRAALLELDDRLLRDVGLTRREALSGPRWTAGGRLAPPPGLPGTHGLAPSGRYW